MINTALQADSSDSSEFQKQPQTHRLKPNSDCCWEQSSECFHAKPGTCQLFLPQNESGREANAWQLSMTETSSSVIQSIHFLKLLKSVKWWQLHTTKEANIAGISNPTSSAPIARFVSDCPTRCSLRTYWSPGHA